MMNTENAAIFTAAELLTMTENQKEDTTMENTTAAVSVIDYVTPDELTVLHGSMLEKAKAYHGLDNAKVTAAVSLAAKESMDKAYSAYNDKVKKNAYSLALASESPIAYLCKARNYSSAHARCDKNGVVSNVFRSTRFDLLDFIAYAKSKNINLPVAGSDDFKAKLKVFAEKLSDYVLACIRKEEVTNIKQAVESLEAVCRCIGVPGVHGRKKDVRFMGFVATRAKELGVLSTIDDKAVVPFIMDMYHVQLLKKEYAFEEKKSESANA